MLRCGGLVSTLWQLQQREAVGTLTLVLPPPQGQGFERIVPPKTRARRCPTPVLRSVGGQLLSANAARLRQRIRVRNGASTSTIYTPSWQETP